jgi:hypothetical protein
MLARLDIYGFYPVLSYPILSYLDPPSSPPSGVFVTLLYYVRLRPSTTGQRSALANHTRDYHHAHDHDHDY